MDALPTSAVDVLKAFPRYQGPGAPGFILDFLGTRTRTSYISSLPEHDGVVEDYPLNVGNFHGTTREWAGALRAVLDAHSDFVAVELGAGWGPWLVATATAARMQGITQVRLVGVEGCKEHHDFMLSHFADNGLDPDEHALLHGVVGVADGVAEFPLLPDPSADWGANAIFPEQPGRWKRWLKDALGALLGRLSPVTTPGPTEKVPCYSVETLLAPYEKVDLVHVDIQGDEAKVIAASHAVLKAKVKWLVVGTHGRQIEADLHADLAGRGWALVADEACMFQQVGDRIMLYRDGCQVWRNPHAARAVRAAA